MKTLAIDFIRQAIEQTLELEHLKNPKYFGGKDQVGLISFYEQLTEQYEVDRFTEIYRDLVDQQNRTGLIMNGTIVAPETPQIMNINSSLIVPLTFNLSFRVTLGDRDTTIETLDNLVKIMRGRKRDIACFDNGKLFMVGTIANEVLGTPKVNNGDFIGVVSALNVNSGIGTIFTTLTSLGIQTTGVTQLYFEDSVSHKLMSAIYDSTNSVWKVADESLIAEPYDPRETYETGDIVLYHGCKYKALEDIDTPEDFNPAHWEFICYNTTIPEHESFEKYKVSISFDSMRIDEPKTTNAKEYCTIALGGSATVVDSKVMVGNDLTKVSISKYSLKLKTQTLALDRTKHWLEPLEQPSGLGISGELSQLTSGNFIQNKHNDGINPTFSYSFVLDDEEPLISQLFDYSRYGIQGTPENGYSDGVTPNTIYQITELWSKWGVIKQRTFLAKATDTIDDEVTESDAMSIKLTFEKQKEE